MPDNETDNQRLSTLDADLDAGKRSFSSAIARSRLGHMLSTTERKFLKIVGFLGLHVRSPGLDWFCNQGKQRLQLKVSWI
ncbi:hypothetical protein DENIT_20067 [Pseudomonas veronii]|nr:hypothetical protein DENIT_20067 [Pseudomonas veronii]